MRAITLVVCLALGLAILHSGLLAVAQDPPADPAPVDDPPAADSYRDIDLRGWTVTVNQTVLDDADHWQRVREELDSQLFRIARRLPADALKRLRSVRIWVERKTAHCACACYHPNLQWLKDNGVNPRKHHCVEIGNTDHFLAWTLDQPAMVLHELSHAWHDQAVPGGFDNARVRACYDHAVDSGIYNEVLHTSGNRRRAYALENCQEYFAECSEAFFLTNDFFPFVHAELVSHDPQMAALLTELWLVQPPAADADR